MANSHLLVDMDFALSQLSGNSSLLSKMLTRFVDEFHSIPVKVINAIELNNLQDAKTYVHTAKGMSGNLGLIALYECSKELDQQIRDDEIDTNLVQVFASIMEETCNFIVKQNFDTNETRTFASPIALDECNKEQNVGREKNTLLNKLKHNEFIDDDTLFTLISALSLNEKQKHTLKELVEELQYTEAIEMVEKKT